MFSKWIKLFKNREDTIKQTDFVIEQLMRSNTELIARVLDLEQELQDALNTVHVQQDEIDFLRKGQVQ